MTRIHYDQLSIAFHYLIRQPSINSYLCRVLPNILPCLALHTASAAQLARAEPPPRSGTYHGLPWAMGIGSGTSCDMGRIGQIWQMESALLGQ